MQITPLPNYTRCMGKHKLAIICTTRYLLLNLGLVEHDQPVADPFQVRDQV